MKEKSITQYRLALDLSINQGQLSRFLKCNDQLSTRNLQNIFDYLNIKIS
jgi:hypothetical protein